MSDLLPEGFAALIDKLAEANAPKPVVKAPRASMLGEARAAVESGAAFPPLGFSSLANASYNKRSDRVWKLAVAGDLAGLEALEVQGVNTYARAVAQYREAAIAWVKRWKMPVPAPQISVATDLGPKPPTKPKGKKPQAATQAKVAPPAKGTKSKASAVLAKRRAAKGAGLGKGVKAAA